MKDLIGMCIDNTSQISNTIGITLDINDTMSKINGLMETEEDSKNTRPNQGDLLESIGQSMGLIKQDYNDYCNKIEKRPKM
jgi:hypothetical protein